MGRITKRVPMEFDWPLRETWDGYLMPKRLAERECGTCDGAGYSPEAGHLKNRWYGYVPFDPAETGSTPLTPETPGVRAFAERNIANAPGFYGTSEASIVREAQRLADLWNGMWSHHLAQEDVDALIAGGRLMDFTHTWTRETRWQPRDPMPTVTASEVNAWSIAAFGLGHDSLNQTIVVKAACNRLGLPHLCATCEGHGSIERWPGQRAEAESWESIEPPKGDGWQMWEDTSEGSPISPVFATPEDLAEWLAPNETMFGHDHVDAGRWLKIITGEDFAHIEVAPGVIVM